MNHHKISVLSFSTLTI